MHYIINIFKYQQAFIMIYVLLGRHTYIILFFGLDQTTFKYSSRCEKKTIVYYSYFLLGYHLI